jgi:hypothetical protein
MKLIKNTIRTTFNLSNNQANLLLLSTGTSLFQGFIYYMIDEDRFSFKYFAFTVLMSFIYYIFYYKTYITDKKKK